MVLIAYVFWHRRKEDCSEQLYEDRLREFHNILGSESIKGFEGSMVAKISSAPWLSSKEGYEDWYLLDNSEVLDRINEAAVSGSRKDPHDGIAHLATDFRGGLYQLKFGSVSSTQSISRKFEIWLSKPPGTQYDNFYNSIRKVMIGEESSLWRRYMVLGPTQEFCILCPQKIELSSLYNPLVISRELLWRRED